MRRLIMIIAVGGWVGVIGIGTAFWYWHDRGLGATTAEHGVRAGTIDSRTGKKIKYWVAPMDPTYIRNEPGKSPMGMDLVPVYEDEGSAGEMPGASAAAPDTSGAADTLERAPISLDLRRQQIIGVRTVPVELSELTRTIRTVGLVAYDETRLADVNMRINGWVEDLHVDYTGRFVRAGDPLFTLYSPELLATQQEYLLALETRDRLQHSLIPDVRESANRLLASTRQRLALWDLPPDQIEGLEKARHPKTTLLFRSPATGYVVDKRVVKGMRVTPGDTLYRIADLSTVWVEADFYESEVAVLERGQRATVTLDAYPGERFAGRIIYIYPYVAEKTRTARVRFAFPNPGDRLKPGMYANVELDVSLGAGLTVPTNALLDAGTRQFVFVSQGNGHFEPRRVRAGQRLAGAVKILDGLEKGEHVATNATFFIDAESQLRAALDGFEALAAIAEPVEPGERLQIAYRSEPDPPRMGTNRFEVILRDPQGQPVMDAEVSVTFFMAAMPAMNMPAMRTEAALAHAGDGVYRGTGNVVMAGRWEVTVTVTRDGRRIGSQQLTVVAR